MTGTLPGPGDQIGGYRLLREIGRGAMGVVYEAAATEAGAFVPPGRRVALKLLVFPPLLPDSERDGLILRFAREARALASIRHPNVVRVYEVDHVDGQPYLVMEYLAGANARERLLSHGRMHPDQVVRLGIQLCEALDAVHRAGIIHRDIKPDNVVIEADDTIRLTDFGIARLEVEASLTRTGGMVGSPAYMAPEQILGGAVDARADLFSAGVTLYQMVTGELPFQGGSIMEVAHKVAYEPPLPMPGVPPALADILLRAMEKDPERRYTSAAQLRDALAQKSPAGSPGVALTSRPLDLKTGGSAATAASCPTTAAAATAVGLPLSHPVTPMQEQCARHTGRTAVAHCAECEAPVCGECASHRRGQIWCADHAAPRARPAWVIRLEVLAIGLLFALLLWSLYPIHW